MIFDMNLIAHKKGGANAPPLVLTGIKFLSPCRSKKRSY